MSFEDKKLEQFMHNIDIDASNVKNVEYTSKNFDKINKNILSFQIYICEELEGYVEERIYGYLNSFKNEDNGIIISMPKLGEEIKISVPSIYKALKRLEEKQIISRVKQDMGMPNKYYILKDFSE